MEFQAYEDFNKDVRVYIPLWKEVVVRLFGKRVGYTDSLLTYRFRGRLYIVK